MTHLLAADLGVGIGLILTGVGVVFFVVLFLTESRMERFQVWGYQVVLTRDGTEAWNELSSEDPPALAILDWVMPGLEGVEICRRLRAREGRYVYTILLTGRDRKQDIVEGMSAGADDYLTKPYDSHELMVRVRAGRRLIDLHAALLEAQEVLRQQAARDPLTGQCAGRA